MTSVTRLIDGVDFITLWTRDFKAAEEFYGVTLGLPCIERYERVPGAEFETGNLTLQVLDAGSVGRDFRPHPPIALHVEDVAAARAELESRGVRFIQAFDSGVCHDAVFEDPDGNVLLLHHRYAPEQRHATHRESPLAHSALWTNPAVELMTVFMIMKRE